MLGAFLKALNFPYYANVQLKAQSSSTSLLFLWLLIAKTHSRVKTAISFPCLPSIKCQSLRSFPRLSSHHFPKNERFSLQSSSNDSQSHGKKFSSSSLVDYLHPRWRSGENLYNVKFVFHQHTRLAGGGKNFLSSTWSAFAVVSVSYCRPHTSHPASVCLQSNLIKPIERKSEFPDVPWFRIFNSLFSRLLRESFFFFVDSPRRSCSDYVMLGENGNRLNAVALLFGACLCALLTIYDSEELFFPFAMQLFASFFFVLLHGAKFCSAIENRLPRR